MIHDSFDDRALAVLEKKTGHTLEVRPTLRETYVVYAYDLGDAIGEGRTAREAIQNAWSDL